MEWTCGDVLCISYARKEKNSVSSNNRNCMGIKMRLKYNGRFMNNRCGSK